jgi:hypothetical protein
MKVILIKWFDGVEWDYSLPSIFNPNKKKSATEHLIETGGLDVDEAVESFDKFKKYPLKVSQYKLANNTEVNWITEFIIEENDSTKAEIIQNALIENYTKKQSSLASGTSGYRIEIETTTTEELSKLKQEKNTAGGLGLI